MQPIFRVLAQPYTVRKKIYAFGAVPAMADNQPIDISAIPLALAQLVVVNVKYEALICLGSGCSRAVRPLGFLKHVSKQKHPITSDGRKQGQEYTQAFPHDYTYSTILLPLDGLAPQPIIAVVDGLQCQKCPHQPPNSLSRPYRSQSRKKIKVHRNKEHSLKDIADDKLFQLVRMKSWFREGKERYWVVDEGQQERQVHRAPTQDVGEESNDLEANVGSGSKRGDSQDDSQRRYLQ